jgi:hypothetical protein
MYRQPIKLLLLALALLVVSRPSLAAPSWPTGNCHGCRISPLGPACTSGVGLGGYHKCFLMDDLCQLEDPCEGPVTHIGMSIQPATIREIAETHPRVAATVWAATHTGGIAGNGSTYWYNSPITAADVEALMQNGTVALEKAPGDPVVYRYYLDEDPATGQRSLVIKPQQASDLDAPFSAFVLELKPVEGSEGYVAGGWSLF